MTTQDWGTPQQPAASVPAPPALAYIGVGRRFVATIIDIVVLTLIGWVIALATGDATATGFELTGLPALLLMLLSFGYYIAMEATRGATLGKLAVGVRVCKTDGSPLDWGASTVRNVLRIVDGFAFYLVGAILVWTSPTRQRLGDRVAGTVVVRRSS